MHQLASEVVFRTRTGRKSWCNLLTQVYLENGRYRNDLVCVTLLPFYLLFCINDIC